MTDIVKTKQKAILRLDPTAKIIFSLAIIFFTAGAGLILGQRHLDVDPVWVLLFVPFSLAMTGALVLFHFLSSSASIDRDAYKVGGAVAGFLVLFSTFYTLSREPFLGDPNIRNIAQGSFGKQIRPIAERYEEILGFNNGTITKVADSSLVTLKLTFDQLAHGTYLVDADELPTYLLPMIHGSRQSYYATQFVLPEKFWGQYWAQKYFDENVIAVVERHVDLIRIFIIDPLDGPTQQHLLDNIIKKHVENKIAIRLIETKEYLKAHNNDDDDLRDILIVDGQLSGLLLLNKGGTFNKVEFSIDKSTVEKRQRNFERLLASSSSYEDWIRTSGSRAQ